MHDNDSEGSRVLKEDVQRSLAPLLQNTVMTGSYKS